MIEIDIHSYEEFINDFSFNDSIKEKDYDKYKEYIKANWKKTIEYEEDSLYDIINLSNNSIQMIITVRDNMGCSSILNDDGIEIGEYFYYTNINL